MKKYLITTGLLFALMLELLAYNPHHRNNRVVIKEKRGHNQVYVVKEKRGRKVKVLPVGYSTVVYGGRDYYYHQGRFYNGYNGAYVAIAPPIGIHVRILPSGYRKIIIGGNPFFYFSGTYYRQIGDEYETVEPAKGTLVPELPMDDVEKVIIDGQTYYEYDKVLYKPVVTESGVQYEVAGQLDN